MKRIKALFVTINVLVATFIFIYVFKAPDNKNVHAATRKPFKLIAEGFALKTDRMHNWTYSRKLTRADGIPIINNNSDVSNRFQKDIGIDRSASGSTMSPGKHDNRNYMIDDDPVTLDIQDKYNWSYTGTLHRDFHQFAPAMNMTEYTMFIDLIKIFKRACEAYNITYMLEMGTVLGAYRHHGFVPWDDDFDCMVNVSQKNKLKKALTGISGHGLFSTNNSFWKFYNNNSAKAGQRGYKWPFLDIFFFMENGTHVNNVNYIKQCYCHPKSDILPLENGIFENLILPVPRNMEAYLNKRYNMRGQCTSTLWSHRTESRRKSLRIPCQDLFGVYPFVHKFQVGDTTFEELRLGSKVLYTVQSPSMKLLKPKVQW